jgi:hypothetical protein
MTYERITIDPDVMGGVRCIGELRGHGGRDSGRLLTASIDFALLFLGIELEGSKAPALMVRRFR